MPNRQRHPTLLVSPKPPPLHGAALAVQYLLEAPEIAFVHIDAKFAENISDLQGLNFRKLRRLAGYLLQMIWQRRKCRTVILTPTFLPKPFLKDALFIWLAWLLRMQTVAWYHMNFDTMRYELQPKWFQRFARMTLRRVNHHVVVAKRLLAKLPKFIANGDLRAIPNGIPPVLAQSAETVWQERAANGETEVLFLSNFSVEKGWRVLLEAAKKLCAEFSDARFTFYGSPTADSPLTAIEQAFAESGFCDRITYKGTANREQKIVALQHASLFCLPSFNEAFPLTVLEAMAAALPVVATTVGGIPDAIENGQGGFLVEPQNGEGLTDALRSLLTNSEQRQQMGLRNYQRYLELYDVVAYQKRWATFLRECTSR